MVDNRQLIDALVNDKDFDDLYNALKNTQYVQTRVFYNNNNPSISININTIDKKLTAKDIVNFVISNINNTKDLSYMVKLTNHFMLTLYITCEVWELFRKNVLNYNNIPIDFDTTYCYPSLSNSYIIYGSDSTDFSVILYLKPLANNLHTVITFNTNKEAADQDGYYLNSTEIKYWTKSSPVKSFSKFYNLANLDKNLIKKDLESLYK